MKKIIFNKNIINIQKLRPFYKDERRPFESLFSRDFKVTSRWVRSFYQQYNFISKRNYYHRLKKRFFKIKAKLRYYKYMKVQKKYSLTKTFFFIIRYQKYEFYAKIYNLFLYFFNDRLHFYNLVNKIQKVNKTFSKSKRFRRNYNYYDFDSKYESIGNFLIKNINFNFKKKFSFLNSESIEKRKKYKEESKPVIIEKFKDKIITKLKNEKKIFIHKKVISKTRLTYLLSKTPVFKNRWMSVFYINHLKKLCKPRSKEIFQRNISKYTSLKDYYGSPSTLIYNFYNFYMLRVINKNIKKQANLYIRTKILVVLISYEEIVFFLNFVYRNIYGYNKIIINKKRSLSFFTFKLLTFLLTFFNKKVNNLKVKKDKERSFLFVKEIFNLEKKFVFFFKMYLMNIFKKYFNYLPKLRSSLDNYVLKKLVFLIENNQDLSKFKLTKKKYFSLTTKMRRFLKKIYKNKSFFKNHNLVSWVFKKKKVTLNKFKFFLLKLKSNLTKKSIKNLSLEVKKTIYNLIKFYLKEYNLKKISRNTFRMGKKSFIQKSKFYKKLVFINYFKKIFKFQYLKPICFLNSLKKKTNWSLLQGPNFFIHQKYFHKLISKKRFLSKVKNKTKLSKSKLILETLKEILWSIRKFNYKLNEIYNKRGVEGSERKYFDQKNVFMDVGKRIFFKKPLKFLKLKESFLKKWFLLDKNIFIKMLSNLKKSYYSVFMKRLPSSFKLRIKKSFIMLKKKIFQHNKRFLFKFINVHKFKEKSFFMNFHKFKKKYLKKFFTTFHIYFRKLLKMFKKSKFKKVITKFLIFIKKSLSTKINKSVRKKILLTFYFNFKNFFDEIFFKLKKKLKCIFTIKKFYNIFRSTYIKYNAYSTKILKRKYNEINKIYNKIFKKVVTLGKKKRNKKIHLKRLAFLKKTKMCFNLSEYKKPLPVIKHFFSQSNDLNKNLQVSILNFFKNLEKTSVKLNTSNFLKNCDKVFEFISILFSKGCFNNLESVYFYGASNREDKYLKVLRRFNKPISSKSFLSFHLNFSSKFFDKFEISKEENFQEDAVLEKNCKIKDYFTTFIKGDLSCFYDFFLEKSCKIKDYFTTFIKGDLSVILDKEIKVIISYLSKILSSRLTFLQIEFINFMVLNLIVSSKKLYISENLNVFSYVKLLQDLLKLKENQIIARANSALEQKRFSLSLENYFYEKKLLCVKKLFFRFYNKTITRKMTKIRLKEIKVNSKKIEINSGEVFKLYFKRIYDYIFYKKTLLLEKNKKMIKPYNMWFFHVNYSLKYYILLKFSFMFLNYLFYFIYEKFSRLSNILRLKGFELCYNIVKYKDNSRYYLGIKPELFVTTFNRRVRKGFLFQKY